MKLAKHVPWLVLLAVVVGLSAVADQRAVINIHLDVPRYFYEAELVAKGLVPYRDFTWQYPPAAVYLLGWWFALFGIGFAQAALFLSAVSAAIAFLLFGLARKAGATSWEALAVVLFIVFASWQACQSEFFSLNVYTGAVPIGWAFALANLFFLLQAQASKGRRQLLCCLAASIAFAGALLSKQEATLAVVMTNVYLTFALWIAARGKSSKTGDLQWSWIGVGASTLVGVLFALTCYAVIASQTGVDNLRQGLAGYGLGRSESLKLLSQLPVTLRAWFTVAKNDVDFLLFVLAVGGLLVWIMKLKPMHAVLMIVASIFAVVAIEVATQQNLCRPSAIARWALESSMTWMRVMLPIAVAVVVPWAALAEVHDTRFANHRSRHSQTLLALAAVLLLCFLLLSRLYIEGPAYPASSALAGIVALVLFPLSRRIQGETSSGAGILARILKPERVVCTALLGLAVVAAAHFSVSGLRTGHSSPPYRVVETKRGPITISEREAIGLKELMDLIAYETDLDESVVFLHYSSALNFFIDRPSPFLQTQFQKMAFTGELAEQVKVRFGTASPSLFVVQRIPDPGWQWLYELGQSDAPAIWKKLQDEYVMMSSIAGASGRTFEIYQRRSDLPQVGR